ncbi:hypothetical protein HPB50_001307 [Hyalomma asiaticum]|uniref:Uncharacterized protein n=1 Tax=Hyalomma asiaticum TaxID=266040 RepID=A0ACB7SD70_HYAAI|nr:hypothetical protein HPB50_001307 [Hyalomma asiaticum]
MRREKEVEVKGRRCLIIDPGNQAIRLKVHWLLHNLQDEDVCEALAPYGVVRRLRGRDEADVKEVCPGDTQKVKEQETTPGQTPHEKLDSRAGARQEKAKKGNDSQKAQSSGDQDSQGPQSEEVDVASASRSVTKRSRDQVAGEQHQTGDPTSEEPPPKAVVTRRPTFRRIENRRSQGSCRTPAQAFHGECAMNHAQWIRRPGGGSAAYLREGRCALATSFSMFQFISLYSVIQFLSVILLYHTGVRSLEALGVASSTYGAHFLTVIRKSIPSELCLNY